MNWKEYEKTIHETLAKQFPENTIEHNQSIKGKMSKSDRQIDILIEDIIAGHRMRIVVDTKSYKETKVDVKGVESFLGMMADVDAHKGMLVTTKGYTKGAVNRAFHDSNKDLELEILNFDELKQFDGFGGIIHKGNCASMVPAPFGWIIDGARNHPDFLAAFYQRGLGLMQAVESNEWIYTNLEPFHEKTKNLKEFLDFQESHTRENLEGCEIEYEERKISKDKILTFREIKYRGYEHREITGFREFDDFIFYAVLLTPKESYGKNIRKLEYIMDKALRLKIDNKSC